VKILKDVSGRPCRAKTGRQVGHHGRRADVQITTGIGNEVRDSNLQLGSMVRDLVSLVTWRWPDLALLVIRQCGR